MSSSSSAPIVLDLLSPNWGAEAGITINKNGDSIVVAPSETGKSVLYSYAGPVNLSGSTFTVVLNFDSAAAASNKGIALHNTAGDWWVDNCSFWWFDDSEIGTDRTYSCNLFTASAAEGQSFDLRVQVFAGAGTVTVKSATLQLAQ